MFHTVLFDIDGVMLSEERYFDASALTVHELLYSPQYLALPPDGVPPFHPTPPEADIRRIRREVFADDRVLRMMKDRGVNANWDMVYLQVAYQLTRLLTAWVEREPGAVDKLPELLTEGWTRMALQRMGAEVRRVQLPWRADFAAFAADLADARSKAELFAGLEQRLQSVAGTSVPAFAEGRHLWQVGQETFQEWYLGDEYVPATRQPGKRGFLKDELPIVDPAAFSALLQRLTELGVRLGIATGRPEIETRVPLSELGWLQWFERQRITTASDVLAAETQLPSRAPLAKPHPFSYLRSYLGTADAAAVLAYPLPLAQAEADGVLIVGDSVADRLAAQSIGCRFAAVLTGLEGEAARPQFEQLNADYVFSHVLELQQLFA